jgi:hypothetical protein
MRSMQPLHAVAPHVQARRLLLGDCCSRCCHGLLRRRHRRLENIILHSNTWICVVAATAITIPTTATWHNPYPFGRWGGGGAVRLPWHTRELLPAKSGRHAPAGPPGPSVPQHWQSELQADSIPLEAGGRQAAAAGGALAAAVTWAEAAAVLVKQRR